MEKISDSENLTWLDHMAEPASLKRFVDLSTKCLEENLGHKSLLSMVILVIEEVDKLWEEIRLGEPQYDCHKGCSWCCHQNVTVTLPELLNIVRYVNLTFDLKMFQKLKKSFAGKSAQIRGKTSDERFDARIPCIFLREGVCSIHPVRPLQCRGGFSEEETYCQKLLENRESTQQAVTNGTIKGKFLIAPKLIYNSAQIGMIYAMRAIGQKGLTFELSLAIAKIFGDIRSKHRESITEGELESASLITYNGITRTPNV